MPGRLDGKVAVVSGAGRGIGRSIAARFAAEGAEVLLFARTAPELEAACNDIKAAGGAAAWIAADAATEDGVAAAVAAAEQHFGRPPDVFVANAGWYPECRLEDMALQQWRDVIDVNLTSAFLAIQASLPGMRRNGGGRIVLISSISGPVTALPGFAHYAAGKAGLRFDP